MYIKKLFTAFILLIPFSLLAQTTNKSAANIDIPINIPANFPVNSIDFQKLNMENFSFGFQLMPSVNWINVIHNDIQTDGAALKFGVGGIAEYEVLSFLSVVSGVNYTGSGGYVFDNASLSRTDVQENYKINYSQIEVPLSLKISTPVYKKFRYFAMAGISACFTITASERYRSKTSNTALDPVDILPYTNASRGAYHAGVGFDYQIFNKASLFGKFMYNNSLTNIAYGSYYVSQGRYTTEPQLYPGAFEISFGLLFHQK